MPEPTRSRKNRLPIPHTQVEYLLAADAVEALGGKLYLMGGGWDIMFVSAIEKPALLSLAVGVLVPWNETDEDHTLSLSIEDPENQPIQAPLSLTFRTGRSPTMEPGAPTHVPVAIKGEFTFPGFGVYSVRATIDDRAEDTRTFSFSVRPVGTGLRQPPIPPAPR